MIDLSFIANRTIGYGATTLVVLLIVQVAYEMARWELHEIALALAVSLGISLVTGIFIARFHKLLGTLVDRVLFRKRLAADKRLSLVAGAMLSATSERAVDEMLVSDAAETLGPVPARETPRFSLLKPYRCNTTTHARAICWRSSAVTNVDDKQALNATFPTILSQKENHSDPGCVRMRVGAAVGVGAAPQKRTVRAVHASQGFRPRSHLVEYIDAIE